MCIRDREYNIHQKFEGTAAMLGQESRVNHRLFLVGVSVEVTAHILHAVQDAVSYTHLDVYKRQVQ